MLGQAEARLLLREGQIALVHIADVPKAKFGVNEVVAGVELTVVLERHRLAAHRRAGAHLRR